MACFEAFVGFVDYHIWRLLMYRGPASVFKRVILAAVDGVGSEPGRRLGYDRTLTASAIMSSHIEENINMFPIEDSNRIGHCSLYERPAP